MAFLVNRNPAARIECLHALCMLINAQFGTERTFTLKDVKFKKGCDNIYNYCTLLESSIGLRYCPYKQSPLDDAGCSLTNGINADTTKSKEVSNTINALHALGFVNRTGNKCQLTTAGSRFASTDYSSEEMVRIIRQAVINYGPVVGVLSRIRSKMNERLQFCTKDISVGYPNTKEAVEYKNKRVILSVGSQADSNVRTKSCLLAWLTTAGFIYPKQLNSYENIGFPQVIYRDFLNGKQRNAEIYACAAPFFEKMNGPYIVQRPLDYRNLTKLTSALRERGSAIIRECTLHYENVINNRRFAIIYLLNQAYKNKTSVNLDEIIALFNNHRDLFVVSEEGLRETVISELDIAFMAGIPYEIHSYGDTVQLRPENGVNDDELAVGAPKELLEIIK